MGAFSKGLCQFLEFFNWQFSSFRVWVREILRLLFTFQIDKLIAGPKRAQKWESVVTFDPFVLQTCALYFWKWQKISELPKLHPDRGLSVTLAIQKFSAISKNIRHKSVGQTDQKLQLITIFGTFLDQLWVYLSFIEM